MRRKAKETEFANHSQLKKEKQKSFSITKIFSFKKFKKKKREMFKFFVRKKRFGFNSLKKRFCSGVAFDELIMTEKISLARELHEALNLKKNLQESNYIVCQGEAGKRVALAVNPLIFKNTGSFISPTCSPSSVLTHIIKKTTKMSGRMELF